MKGWQLQEYKYKLNCLEKVAVYLIWQWAAQILFIFQGETRDQMLFWEHLES